ncbi:MAG: pyridoxamine 5'-phosphate oxidase family protein [Acidimicrobiales bacterium]|nr:pyridoxamine 5'-phosphate oxidase family protein [Acidimicrobiales bacterium]
MTDRLNEAIQIKRAADRGRYDTETINAIADAGLVAHVGTIRDGQPVVIPMFCVRDRDHLLLHGAPAAGVLRRARAEERTICVEMTLIDGLVLARSAFHHSMNYRSLVVIGIPDEVTEESEKAHALEMFVERLIPGRQADLRPNNQKEIQGTAVFRVSLEQASAKVRSGPPIDDDEDYELDIWAGVVPTRLAMDDPIDDPRLLPGVSVPANVTAYVRGD